MTMIGYGAPWYILYSALCFFTVLERVFFTHSESRKQHAKQIIKSAIYLLLVLAVTGLIVTLLKIGIGRFRPSMLAEHGLAGFSPFNFTLARLVPFRSFAGYFCRHDWASFCLSAI